MKQAGKWLRGGVAALCSAALVLTQAVFAPAMQSGAGSATATLSLDVEGASSQIFAGNVSFTPGESVYDILSRTLKVHGIDAAYSDASLGKQIDRIGTDAVDNYNTYFTFYVNEQYAPLGFGSVYPSDGDRVIFAYSGWPTQFPWVEFSPARPVKGKPVSVHLTSSVYNFKTGSYDTVDLCGVSVTLGNQTVQTGTDGKAALTMPETAGICTIHVAEEGSGPAPAVVRRDIPLRVYDSLPVGDDGAGTSLVTDDSLDVCATGAVAAQLGAAANGSAVTATVGADKTVVVRNILDDYRLNLLAGTVISGPASWDGMLALPQNTADSAKTIGNGAVKKLVGVGDPDAVLTLSKPARLVLPGQHGLSAGYFDGDGVFHRATRILTADATPDDLPAGTAAVYDNGTDLVVYTTVLAEFAAYSDATAAGLSDAALSADAKAAAAALASDSSRWGAFARARAGYSPAAGWLAALKTEITANGGKYPAPSSLGGAILVLSANGVDPARFCGLNLTERLYNNADLDKAGLSGPVWALLALDSRAYPVPAGAKWSRASLLKEILSAQNSDGSFVLSKNEAGDVDMTAMALTALTPHISDAAVNAAVQKGLEWLSEKQQNDGGFVSTMGGTSVAASESVSTVLIALCSLGIDPRTDVRFIKGSHSLLASLLSFRTGGAFRHIAGGKADTMATEQALMALTAYSRLTAGKTSLYDLSDASAGVMVGTGTSKTASAGGTNPNTGDAGPVADTGLLFTAAAVLAAARRRGK